MSPKSGAKRPVGPDLVLIIFYIGYYCGSSLANMILNAANGCRRHGGSEVSNGIGKYRLIVDLLHMIYMI